MSEMVIEKIFRPIHYFVMFGEHGMTMMPVVPPPEFAHLLLRLLGRLPKSLVQFQLGIDYYVQALNAHSQVGYDVTFVYADTFPGRKLDMWPSDDLFVFFICTNDTSLEKEFQRLMDRFADYDDIRPNYLLYSTLGRADLIRFESYLQNKYASQSHE